MNPILKASIAGALTLGAVSAHAAFTLPTTSNPGDLVLFAEVLNSSGHVVGSYAGDTNIAVLGGATQAAISGNQTASMNDGTGNLASLLALDTGTNTLVWSIEGGGQITTDNELADPGAAQFYTTQANNNISQISSRPNSAMDTMANMLDTVRTLNANSGGASSVFGTSAAAAGIFDTTTVATNPANWFLAGGATGVAGTGTSWHLYSVTEGAVDYAVTEVGTVTLTANGVTFAPPQHRAATGRDLAAGQWLAGSRRRGPSQGRRPDRGLNLIFP